jgi:hypothetical protein
MTALGYVWVGLAVDPADVTVHVDGDPVDVRDVTVHAGQGEVPTVTVTHDCGPVTVEGRARIEHRCGLNPTAGEPVPVSILHLLRDLVQAALLGADVSGQDLEAALENVADFLTVTAFRVASTFEGTRP